MQRRSQRDLIRYLHNYLNKENSMQNILTYSQKNLLANYLLKKGYYRSLNFWSLALFRLAILLILSCCYVYPQILQNL